MDHVTWVDPDRINTGVEKRPRRVCRRTLGGVPERRMRIALVCTRYASVPPDDYGGTERVIGALANELSARGHEVTLFAAGGSDTAADLIAASDAPLRM